MSLKEGSMPRRHRVLIGSKTEEGSKNRISEGVSSKVDKINYSSESAFYLEAKFHLDAPLFGKLEDPGLPKMD